MTPGGVASLLLVPPLNLAVLALIVLALAGRRRAARLLGAAALLALLVTALPVCGRLLLTSLERGLPAEAADPAPGAAAPGAIVVLGGDVTRVALSGDPPAGTTPVIAGGLTLERMRAGAALARRTRLPMLVTGGALGAGETPVAELMANGLRDDFAAAPRWVEPRSRDTWENAKFSAAILKGDGIGSVYLVTQAWHMRRAMLAFARFGIAALPAPTYLDAPPRFTADEFVPHVSGWLVSYFGLHEWVGLAWYSLR